MFSVSQKELQPEEAQVGDVPTTTTWSVKRLLLLSGGVVALGLLALSGWMMFREAKSPEAALVVDGQEHTTTVTLGAVARERNDDIVGDFEHGQVVNKYTVALWKNILFITSAVAAILLLAAVSIIVWMLLQGESVPEPDEEVPAVGQQEEIVGQDEDTADARPWSFLSITLISIFVVVVLLLAGYGWVQFEKLKRSDEMEEVFGDDPEYLKKLNEGNAKKDKVNKGVSEVGAPGETQPEQRQTEQLKQSEKQQSNEQPDQHASEKSKQTQQQQQVQNIKGKGGKKAKKPNNQSSSDENAGEEWITVRHERGKQETLLKVKKNVTEGDLWTQLKKATAGFSNLEFKIEGSDEILKAGGTKTPLSNLQVDTVRVYSAHRQKRN